MAASEADQSSPAVREYAPNGPFPYSAKELTPSELGNDRTFYSVPR